MRFENIPNYQEWQKASSSFLQSRNKPTLIRIDDLIKKYPQVLDMAKLNILMELKNAIVDWAQDKINRDVESGRWEAMQALEEVVLRKLYELDGWGKHRYLKTVCIGYEVKVGDYTTAVPSDLVKRKRDETVDVGKRCTDLTTAIKAAYGKYAAYASAKNIPADEDRKILKIFMAPEFYFRGPYGAYADIAWLGKIFSMMRQETGKPQYADWLFVLGTALFSTDKMEKNKKVGLLLENFAIVQKGGPKTSEHHDFYVEKEFPSHVDFKHPGISDVEWYDATKSKASIAGTVDTTFSPEGGRKDPIYNPLDASMAGVSELVGGGIFTMDGITFGLEVCRDHYLKRLAHSKENGTILIQLVPSCGMDIEDASVACVPDGIVFNVDADTPHVHIKVRSTSPQPAEAKPTVKTGTGKIRLFEAVKIPWPGLASAQVARKLNVGQNKLSGVAPPPVPPKPASLKPAAKGAAASVGNNPVVPPSVKKFGVPVVPPFKNK